MNTSNLLKLTTAFAGSALLLTADALAGVGPQPSICNRACWAARAPRCSISQMANLSRAIIHHTAGTGDYTTADDRQKVRNIQNYHMDSNGWCDIGYHWLVNAGGYIYEGRSGSWSTKPRGSHDGCNTDSFGYNVMGYYHPPYNQAFTSASRNSLEAVIAWRMPSTWSATGSGTYCSVGGVGTLDGHYRVKSTACPGDGIIPHIPGIRNGVMARKNGSGGTLNNRVGIARTADGGGYWIVASDGGVFSFGNAVFYGSMGGQPLNSPVVGMAARPQGDGYWLVAADGGIFCFGAAGFYGSMGGQPLNQPIVGMASTADGTGYWLMAKDGGIFSFNAPFHGSWGGQGLTDFVGIAAAPSNGYWLVRATGSIYSFGPVNYYGGGEAVAGVVGIAPTSNGGGYWQVRNVGAIYSYGNAGYAGGANELTFVGIARGPNDGSYWLVKSNGAIFSFGAPYHGGANF